MTDPLYEPNPEWDIFPHKYAMTPNTEAELMGDLERLRRTVAKAHGWKCWQDEESGNLGGDWSKVIWTPPNDHHVRSAQELPNFTGSLDACRTFEAGLTEEEQDIYDGTIGDIAYKLKKYEFQLTPVDHCIAFLKLKGVCE